MENIIKIILYTVPQAACGSGQMSWQDVAAMVRNQLERHYAGKFHFEHIEFMDDRWFSETHAQELLERGEVNLPFVLVDGEIASADKKVNISKIKKFLQNKISS